MAVVFKNNSTTTLNGSILAGATSITVTNGAVFPTVTARANPTAPVDGPYIVPSSSYKELLHCDGSNGSATFTDAAGHTITNPSSYITQTTTSPKFGTACATNSTTSLSAQLLCNHADFAVGTGDFTMEGWFKPSYISEIRYIFALATSSTNRFSAAFYSNGAASDIRLQTQGSSGGSSNTSSTFTSSTSAFTHIAVERISSNFYVYADGVRVLNNWVPGGVGLNYSVNATNPSQVLFFSDGAFVATYNAFTGTADELVFYSGAKYGGVASFTPPTSGYYLNGDPTQSSSTNSTTAGDYFYATITDGVNREVVKVTNVSGNTLTVTRGQDGTSGTAFASGSTIEIRPTNQGLIDLGDDRFYRDVATRSKRYLGA